MELEGLAGLVADGEGNPLDLIAGVLDVLARFSVGAIGRLANKGTIAAYSGCDSHGSTHMLRFMHSTGMEAP